VKAFVFPRIDTLTSSYHSEGGLLIIAEDRADAERQIAAHNDAPSSWYDKPNLHPTDDEWDSAVVYELAGDAEPRIFLFPDAGCC